MVDHPPGWLHGVPPRLDARLPHARGAARHRRPGGPGRLGADPRGGERCRIHSWSCPAGRWTTIGAEIRERWERWRVERNRRGLRTGLLIIVTLYPTFGVLDWWLAPRHALPWLWLMRCLVTLGALAVFQLVRRPGFDGVGGAALRGVCLAHRGRHQHDDALHGGAGLALLRRDHAGRARHRPALGLATPRRGGRQLVASSSRSSSRTSSRAPSVDSRRRLSNLTFLSAIALIAGVGQVLLFYTQREQLDQRIQLEARDRTTWSVPTPSFSGSTSSSRASSPT